MQVLNLKPRLIDTHNATRLFIPRHPNQQEIKKFRLGYKLREIGINAWVCADEDKGIEFKMVDYKGNPISLGPKKFIRNMVCSDFNMDPCSHEKEFPSVHIYENNLRQKMFVVNHKSMDDNINIIYSFLKFSGYDIQEFNVSKFRDNSMTTIARTSKARLKDDDRPTDSFMVGYLEENLF